MKFKMTIVPILVLRFLEKLRFRATTFNFKLVMCIVKFHWNIIKIESMTIWHKNINKITVTISFELLRYLLAGS